MRSFIFTVVFYVWVAFICVAYLPLLVLPRSLLVGAVRFLMRSIHFLEKTILGLDYKVEGTENIPAHGPYVVAMKHQSAYETLKLAILFDDPAIILKRELLFLPLWGWYTLKLKMIPIDRSKGSQAMAHMLAVAKDVNKSGRPVVIFPQGTRVPVGASPEKYPYKIGTYRLYAALNVPVVPVALDSGKYWPKNGLTKRGGVVTFRFLPAIHPGLDQVSFMARLQAETEKACKEIA